jgi:hypothetical protein
MRTSKLRKEYILYWQHKNLEERQRKVFKSLDQAKGEAESMQNDSSYSEISMDVTEYWEITYPSPLYSPKKMKISR